MAGNRRDLHVSITGDDRGFGGAFEDAKRKAESLDRELGKLDRAQTAQERSATRAAAATRELAREEEKAGLAARKMSLDVERAANAAEKAQARSAAAAKAAERGLLDKEKAARIAARADEAVERAAIKAVEAQLAQAVAAERLAEAQQKAAREAETAAAAQRLGALRAAGAIDEHNAVVRRLRDRYGDLSKEADGAFREIEKTGSRAFRLVSSTGSAAFDGVSKAATNLAESGPGSIALVVGALAAVPFAATLASGAVTLGVGGALAGLGLAATKGDKEVQAALSRMTSHVKDDTKLIAAPFKRTWLDIATTGEDTFDRLEPYLARSFDKLGPTISRFAVSGAAAITEFGPAFEAAASGASALLDALGPNLPDITHNVADAIEVMAHSAADNAGEISHMIVMVSDLLPPLAHMLDLASKAGPALSPFFDVMSHGLDTARALGGGVDWLTGGLTHLGDGFTAAGASFPAFTSGASGASEATSQLDKDMETLASSTASATEKANALTDAFARLLDPEQAVFTDSAKLRDKFSELTQALKGSHGAMNNNSAAARSAVDAFGKVLTQAKTLASDMINAGYSIGTVQKKMTPYIESMYRAAGANKQARALVDAFVRSLQMVPPKKGTTITVPGAASATRQVNAVRSALNALQDKRINVTTYYRQVDIANRTRSAERARANGGIDRYADGGLRRDLDPFIATAPTVLFGETSTGGEAYIPLGAAKRSRSVELLSNVANMFGLALVASGTGPLTGGSTTAVLRGVSAPKPAAAPSVTTSSVAPASSTALDLSGIMQRWTDAVKPATKSDVNSAIKARRTQLDQLKRAEDALYRARHAHHPDRRRIAEDERRVAKERRDVKDATTKLRDVESRYKYSKLSPVQKLGAALALGIKNNSSFIANLQKLADRGFGDLARQLLNMGGPDAEKIAASAVKLSNSKLGTLQKQIKQDQSQQDYLSNLPNILTIRSAISGTKGGISSWVALLNATGLDAGSLAAAVKLMAGDLAKTASGKALLADMKAHGYARGGPVAGPAGVDRVPAWLTADEYVVQRGPAMANRPLLDAINSGARIPIPARSAPAAAPSSGPAQITMHNVYQAKDPHVVARETARELAWTLRS